MPDKEILGLRDWRLSERHRLWGGDCPMADLDFVVTEFDNCRPMALVEYKHCSPSGHSTIKETAQIKTIRALADMACLPAWVAFYRPWTWSFKIAPLNDKARILWQDAEDYIIVTESEYVETLYNLRGRRLPKIVAAKLNETHETLPGLVADFDALQREAYPTAS